MEIFDIFKKYALMIEEQEYSVGEYAKLLLKHADRVYATEFGANFTNLKEEDVIDITDSKLIEKELLMKSKEYNAILISRPPYASICIDAKKPIDAVLDDMASIIGETVKIVPYNKTQMAMKLKKADAVMVENGTLVTTGRSLYEAVVAMTVLEKSAEVILKAPVIGGAKKLSHSDCVKMRNFYKKSYSKAEEEHKNEVEG